MGADHSRAPPKPRIKCARSLPQLLRARRDPIGSSESRSTLIRNAKLQSQSVSLAAMRRGHSFWKEVLKTNLRHRGTPADKVFEVA